MSDDQYLDGVKYISAADAAEAFGFTRDYIGILCRTEKVIGRRIGRNWYVSEESLKSFFVMQEHARAQRRKDLAAQRSQEYRQAHESKRIVEPVQEIKPPQPLIERVVSPISSAAVAASIPAKAVVSAATRNVHEITRHSVEAAQSHGARIAEKTIDSIRIPATAPQALTLSVHSGIAHAPLYAVTPVGELFHKAFALTLAFVLTFGTYSLVDPTYLKLALTTVHDSTENISGGVRELKMMALDARMPLAFSNVNPSAAAASAFSDLPSVASQLAKSINARINSFVFAVAFPGYVYGETPTPHLSRGTVAVQIVPRTVATGSSAPAAIAYSAPSAIQISPVQSGSTKPTTIINNPIRERVVETQRIVVAGGLTDEALTARLQAIENTLTSKLYSLTSANSTASACAASANVGAGVAEYVIRKASSAT